MVRKQRRRLTGAECREIEDRIKQLQDETDPERAVGWVVDLAYSLDEAGVASVLTWGIERFADDMRDSGEPEDLPVFKEASLEAIRQGAELVGCRVRRRER